MIITRLTTKHQTTVPIAVRKVLGVAAGDSVVFEMEDDRVTLRKATPLDVEYSRSLVDTQSEWTSDNDEEAYKNL